MRRESDVKFCGVLKYFVDIHPPIIPLTMLCDFRHQALQDAVQEELLHAQRQAEQERAAGQAQLQVYVTVWWRAAVPSRSLQV